MDKFLDRTLYYFSIFFPILVTVAIFLYFFQSSANKPIITFFDFLLFFSKFFWFTGLWFVLTNLIGFLRYGSPYSVDKQNTAEYKKNGWNPDTELIVTYVSRGDNVEALGRSIQKSKQVLQKLSVNFSIEVVTDISVIENLQDYADVRFHLVPQEYNTKKNALYKARALHYVLEQRAPHTSHRANTDRWILHLDEESSVTPSCIAGIAKFIAQPENNNRVGQGEIQYNSYNYGNHFLNTVTDSVRPGDDLGRFRFQYRMVQKPLFGMHGSFILVPEHIEKHIGFDLGGRGSITEDAYFALIAADQGYKFGWVDGHVREQSPFSLMAIIKQRRRWFCGLWLLSFDPVISLKTRIPLIINTLLWCLAWAGPVVTVVNFTTGGGYFPVALTLSSALIQGGYASVYLVGAYRNLREAEISWLYKVVIYFGSYLLLPVSSMIEGIAIIYAIISPVQTFDVVEK